MVQHQHRQPSQPPPSTGTARRRATLSLERLENRAVPATFFWNGSQNCNFNQAANWTDVADNTHHAVPTATDSAIVQSSPHDPVMNQDHTLAGLQIDGGLLTVSANLTEAGSFSQSGGSMAFGANSNQLQIAGDVTRTGGTFQGAVGTVVLNGSAGQTVTDTSGHTFASNMIVHSGTTVTVQSGSVLSVSGNFTNNGAVNLSMATPAGATPLVVGNNLVEGSGSVFTFTLGNTSAGLSYILITFGGTEPTGAMFNPTTGTVNHNSQSVTLTT
jgi:hypothetical protein